MPGTRQKSSPGPGISCVQKLFFGVANEYLGHPVPDEMVRLASGFLVGMGFAGCACGALTYGVMALGLKFGRSSPAVETPGMFAASKELHDRFRARRKIACCRALTRKFTLGAPNISSSAPRSPEKWMLM